MASPALRRHSGLPSTTGSPASSTSPAVPSSIRRDGELVFSMESTFSISTNPNFRFTFGRGPKNSLDVAVTDTAGAMFAAKSEPSGS